PDPGAARRRGADLRGGDGGHPGGVRDLPAGRVAASQGAARGRFRDGTAGGGPPSLHGEPRAAARRRRVARPFPALLDAAPSGARHRAGAGQAGAPSRCRRRTTPREDSMIEVSEQINAVRRQIGTRVLEAGEARMLTVSQTYDAAIEDVWDACTSPERIPPWFLPVSGD